MGIQREVEKWNWFLFEGIYRTRLTPVLICTSFNNTGQRTKSESTPGQELDRGPLYQQSHSAITPYTLSIKISCVWLFATPWTIPSQVPLSMGFFQARILEWVAISFSRRSSQPRDWTRVSHIVGRCFTVCHQGSHKVSHKEVRHQKSSEKNTQQNQTHQKSP